MWKDTESIQSPRQDSKCQCSQLHGRSPLVHTDAVYMCVRMHVLYLCVYLLGG